MTVELTHSTVTRFSGFFFGDLRSSDMGFSMLLSNFLIYNHIIQVKLYRKFSSESALWLHGVVQRITIGMSSNLNL